MTGANKAGFILGLGALLFAPNASHGQSPPRAPVFQTSRFAFLSDFEPNLNDALIAAGAVRKPGKPELLHSGDERSRTRALAPSRSSSTRPHIS